MEMWPSDEIIEMKVMRKICEDRDFRGCEISARSEAGVVTLSGVADSFWKKTLATEVALSIEGVLDVINDLGVMSVLSDEPITVMQE
jgi:osmotically-inducible protein OsmY